MLCFVAQAVALSLALGLQTAPLGFAVGFLLRTFSLALLLLCNSRGFALFGRSLPFLLSEFLLCELFLFSAPDLAFPLFGCAGSFSVLLDAGLFAVLRGAKSRALALLLSESSSPVFLGALFLSLAFLLSLRARPVLLGMQLFPLALGSLAGPLKQKLGL